MENVQSDTLFDLFSYVPPGFGNGVDNKLYRMDINATRNIKWAEPMYRLRQYDGPEMGISPLPFEWKNVASSNQIKKFVNFYKRDANAHRLSKLLPVTSNLPGDIRYNVSCKGLPSNKRTYFDKQIDLRTPFQSMVNPCGSILSSNDMVRLFDPLVSFTNGKNPTPRNSISLPRAIQTTLGNNWNE
jgi:hypothetical protein